eukprot:gnl/Hemi2/9853_TR3427_c0_g1_i1.p1 gnl/Hemi2/9853_TR3427_c0_g1~~gnl/Hemi2/9853_TR3427_c0_g1_i1.p1  ORF type:complete len:752 (-),score=203.47 gnl/Hemi2/9853_TR3427_c0_g1_i1:173-2428(-)
MQYKINQLSKIEAKNHRVNEIYEILQARPDVRDIQLDKDEMPETALQVSDAEVTVEKFIPPAEVARLEAIKKAEEALLRATRNDAVERAVIEMLGNELTNLKSNRNMMKQPVLEKPEWMANPPAELSAEQQKQLKDYEAKEKLIKDEAEKQRKALETELKNLKNDVNELITEFDKNVVQLYANKLRVNSCINEMEYYVTQLCSDVLNAEENASQEDALKNQIVATQLYQNTVVDRIKNLQEKSSLIASDIEAVELKDNTLEEDTVQHFRHSGDPKTTELIRLFKKRASTRPTAPPPLQTEQSSSGLTQTARSFGFTGRQQQVAVGEATEHAPAQPPSMASLTRYNSSRALMSVAPHGAAAQMPGTVAEVNQKGQSAVYQAQKAPKGDLDPYAQIEEDRENDADQLDISEKPDSVDMAVWDKLVRYRNAKLYLERQLRNLRLEREEFEEHLAWLKSEQSANQLKLEQTREALKHCKLRRIRDGMNLTVMLSLLEGQVEVEAGVSDRRKKLGVNEQPSLRHQAVPDYADAILIDRSNVTKLNQAIIQAGTDKVQMLQMTKEQHRTIQNRVWDIKMANVSVKELVLKTRDVQLTRVTRELQDLVKINAEPDKKAERQRHYVERTAEHLQYQKRIRDRKLEEKKRQWMQVLGQIKKKKAANAALHGNIRKLEAAVAERQTIFEIRMSVVDPNEASKRMSSVVKRRQLLDTAKQQDEEIRLLRRELDAIRLRTFPIFDMQFPLSNPDYKRPPVKTA